MASIQQLQQFKAQLAAANQTAAILTMQMAATEAQSATLAAALDPLRAKASHLHRGLRHALSAEERKSDTLQRLECGDAGNQHRWNRGASKDFAGGLFYNVQQGSFRKVAFARQSRSHGSSWRRHLAQHSVCPIQFSWTSRTRTISRQRSRSQSNTWPSLCLSTRSKLPRGGCSHWNTQPRHYCGSLQ